MPMTEVAVVSSSIKPSIDIMVPIASLNPDLNNDGQVEVWEQKTFDKIKAADTTGSGQISVKQLMGIMHQAVSYAHADGIPITSLDPDSDGDGKIEAWEMEVFKRIQQADEDKSGSISVKELFGVIKGAAESDKQKRLFQRLLGVAVLIIMLLIAAMLGMGIIAGEAVKESHVSKAGDGAGEMLSNTGEAVRVDGVETNYAIWDIPSLSSYELGKMKSLDFYIDMTANAKVGDWAVAQATPSFLYKPSADEIVIHTSAPDVIINIDRLAQSGTIKVGGVYYSISDSLPEAASRRLFDETVEEDHPIPTGDRRRLGRRGRGGALRTSGSFSISSGGNRAGAG